MPKKYEPIKAKKTEEGGVRERFMAAKAELPDEITVVRPFNVDCFTQSNEKSIYIAPNGCDSNCGCEDKPLATLEEALKRASGKLGAKIIFKDGKYNITKTLNITAEHSGTTESPLIITAENEGKAFISSSYEIPVNAFGKVCDEDVLARLNPNVNDKVLVADLGALGIDEFGDENQIAPFLFVNGKTQTIARYPNENEPLLEIGEKGVISSGDDGIVWEAYVDEDRCFNWKNDGNFWLKGNLCNEWAHDYIKVSKFDAEKGTMVGDEVRWYDETVRKQEYTRFFFINVLEEIDTPGEWYLDRKESKLYIYPPEEKFNADDDIRLATTPCDMIKCDGVKNVIINGLNIGRAIGTCIFANECEQVLIQRCHFAGVAPKEIRIGKLDSAIYLLGGKLNGVIATEFEYFGAYAFTIKGGDRAKLIPANNFGQNCILHHPLIRKAIAGGGCGNVISHNYVHNTTMGDSDHNEGIFEYNIIEGGDTESMDSGMIYVAHGEGYGCSSCGNHYRYNFFFDFVKNDYGIYFDDMSRGMYAYGNIVIGNGVNPNREEKMGKWWPSGGRGYNHHNGGEHVFYNNISVDAGFFALGGDITYYISDFEGWSRWCECMYKASLNFRNDEYQGRNPTYKDFCAALDQWKADISDPDYVPCSGWAEMRLRTPWCNHYENNLIVRADRPFKLDVGEATATGLETNFVINEDPGFVNEANKNYALKKDSIVFEKIPGFVAPPFERMGPIDDYE